MSRSTKRTAQRTVPLIAICAATLFGGAAAPADSHKDSQQRPNIVFVFADDHAYQAMQAYNSHLAELNPTPHIDRLAEQGMVFDNAYVTNSICKPSRAVILSGKHSHLNGVPTNRNRIDADLRTFPNLLRKAGYQTAITGKWHLGTSPGKMGFDDYHVLHGQGPYYNPNMRTPDGDVQHTGYTTQIITDQTLSWLKNKREDDQPFMLMYQHKAPHRRWMPGPEYLRMYDNTHIPEPDTLFDDYTNRASPASNQAMEIGQHMRWLWDLKMPFAPGEDGDVDAGYKKAVGRGLNKDQLQRLRRAYETKNADFYDRYEAGMSDKEVTRWKYQRYMKDYLRCIAAIDDGLGRVLEYLEESGLAENTIVIYTSDQGFYLGEHGWFDKRWMYEESLRTPLIVRWPGTVEPGSREDRIVSNLDFAQTFLDIADAEMPGDMQGRSLLPLLKGKAPGEWRDSFYYHYYEYPGAHSVRRHYGVTDGRYKLIHYYRVGEWELFDTKKDPKELNSVYGEPEYADVQQRMKDELERLRDKFKVPEQDPLNTYPGKMRKKIRKQRQQEG